MTICWLKKVLGTVELLQSSHEQNTFAPRVLTLKISACLCAKCAMYFSMHVMEHGCWEITPLVWHAESTQHMEYWT